MFTPHQKRDKGQLLEPGFVLGALIMLLVVLLLFNWDRSKVQLCALLIYSNRMQWCKQRGSEQSALQPPGFAEYALAVS